MEIPYRLDTPEAISEMMNVDLPGIETGYGTMLSVAKRLRLEIPPAMAGARPVVAKDFTVTAGRVISKYGVIRETPREIGDIRDFELIENEIAWVKDVAKFKNIGEFLRTCPGKVQKSCLVDPAPATLSQMLLSNWAIRRFLRREIVCYSKSKRTKNVDLVQFKSFLAAYSLFDPRNEDVLSGLKASGAGNNHRHKQNALAELFFARLPASIAELVIVDPRIIRRKLFAKVAKLPVRGVQKSNLYGQFPVNLRPEDLVPTLQRMDRLFQRLNIASGTKRAFHDYVQSLNGSLLHARSVYRELFISRSLEELHGIYKPRKLRQPAAKKIVIQVPIRSEILEFFPTKDYLDLFRGRISKDCIDVKMGETQLGVPNFFNVRMFRNSVWIGNIYMLDFALSHGVLLIDRIQIPRSAKAEYVHFFEDLKEALSRLFSDVDYEDILTTLSLSNNANIQSQYNRYRKKLKKRVFRQRLQNLDCFESLSAKTYYVFHRKNDQNLHASSEIDI